MTSAFRTAIENRDIEALRRLLSDRVEFRSPAVHKPYVGKEMCSAIIGAVLQVFDDFVYVREFVSADGRDHALEFEATIGDASVNGCDFLHYDDSGKIDDFKVMVRPYNGLRALMAGMAPRFEQIEASATAMRNASPE